MRRSTLIGATALAALLSLTVGFQGSAHAEQAFPSRPIKFIVPYPPGASTDNVARAFAQELSKELKTPVIVENRPGAGNAVGALAFKQQPADGYTLFFQTTELFASKLANPELNYEFNDFEIIAPLARTPFTLVVPASNQIKTLDELKASAVKKKNELDFGSLGLGANLYTMLSRTLSEQLGVKPNMIPYKGGVEGLTAVMSGQIDAYLATVGLAYQQKDNPKIHILALTSDGGANPFFPNVKSFKEQGIKDMVFYSLYGVVVRPDTPEAIKTQLQQAAGRVTNSEEMKRIRRQIALEDFPGTLDEFKAGMNNVRQRMEAAYKQEQKR
ncbi:MAG: tripartite tricarboxylate transporter substrate binding protein [Betaproteobacteria bacterium]|nr:tripartite tricarboxylate transporter substrate binding protein [Betaproteobacteria bacterium]